MIRRHVELTAAAGRDGRRRRPLRDRRPAPAEPAVHPPAVAGDAATDALIERANATGRGAVHPHRARRRSVALRFSIGAAATEWRHVEAPGALLQSLRRACRPWRRRRSAASGDAASRSTSMNAVAPHTVSSSSSKKCSRRSVGRAAPALGAVRVGAHELGQRQPQHPLDLRAGRARAAAIRGRRPTIGHDVAAADDRAEVVELAEQRRPRPGRGRPPRRPRGSAASAGVSPGSMRPPGKLISPLWLRRCRDRRVSSTSAPSLAVGEGDEHGRRPGVGERRRDRPAGRRRRRGRLDVVDA